MLYGNRKELNKKLKRMFGNDERYALLVWTKEDVMAQAENMTEAEAEGFLAHTLIIPGDPARRWFDLAALKNMIIGVRNGLAQEE